LIEVYNIGSKGKMMGELNIGGWLFMILGWGGIILFNLLCFRRLFRESGEKMVSPLDIESEIDRIEDEKEHPMKNISSKN